MKKLTALIIVIFYVLPVCAKNFKQTEEIIKSIIDDTTEKVRVEKKNKEQARKKKETESGSDGVKRDKDEKEDTSPKTSNEEEILLKTGKDFFYSGMYTHSLKKFKELNEKYPNSEFRDLSRVWRGKINIKLYRYEEAIKEFSEIPADSGEYPSAMYYTAESYMLKGDIVSSIENYQKVSSQFPEHYLADNSLLAAGRLYLNTGKGPQALDSAVKLIKYYKTNETIDDAYYLLGKIFEKDPTLKDVENARRIYKLFLSKAASSEKYFAKSPLKERINRDLRRIEKVHFKLEN